EHVEVQIDVGTVQASDTVEKNDIGCGVSAGLAEQVLLEGLLVLDGAEDILVEVLSDDSVSILVQNDDSLDAVE
ncbi:hypothetical protein PENTCL1PPCAC_4403, partial [Pristionchus entomophagus]